jgi:hypothetical protein
MSLVIRDEQLQTMSAAIRQRKAMDIPIDHLHQCFPNESRQMGPLEVRELVNAARDKCATYGIEDTLGLLLYLNLRMVLGESFEDEGFFSWTGDILRGDEPSDKKFQEIFQRLELEEAA